jgi:N-succinyl-L-ornithine transcarbamylase
MIFNKFVQFCKVPVVSLESATRHPLQSLADLITIEELKTTARPKGSINLGSAYKPLPQAVPNSFAEWMCKADVDFTIAHPKVMSFVPILPRVQPSPMTRMKLKGC